MGISVGDLRPAQMDRLRGEIVEVLTAHYAYPAFFDFRAGHSAMRPVDRAKREEVEHSIVARIRRSVTGRNPTSGIMSRLASSSREP